MDVLNKKQKIIIIAIAVFMLLFIGWYIIRKTNNSEYIELEIEKEQVEEKTTTNKESIVEQEIIIHITGEIKNQGIVKVKEGARISDVIDEAGGITSEADLTKINLAYEVKDGQKINVPRIKEEKNIETITQEAGENVLEDNDSKISKVNINTASQTELETLSGVGPSTALKIINYRKENGDFKKIEDIKNVPGIGETKFASFKDSICVK